MTVPRFLLVSAMASLIVCLAAARPAGAHHPEGNVLRVTYVKYPLNAPLIVAKVLGLYEKEFAPDGWSVEWADLATGPRQAEALASGAVHVASVISSDAVLASRARGEPIRALGVFARAPRAFCLLARDPALRSAADLRGRTVAGPKGALLHLMLLAALERQGIPAAQVRFVDMQIAPALNALHAGGVDAALAAGPARIKAEAEGARPVFCGEGLTKGLILTAVNERFLGDHPDVARRYLAVHARALEFMAAYPGRALELIAGETGLSRTDVARMLPEYDFSPGVTPSDVADLEAVQGFLLAGGLMERPVNVPALFWP